MIPKHDGAELVTTIRFDHQAGQVAATIVHHWDETRGEAALSAFRIGHEDDIQMAGYTFSKAVDLSVAEGQPTELGEELSVIGGQTTDLSLGLSDDFGSRADTWLEI